MAKESMIEKEGKRQRMAKKDKPSAALHLKATIIEQERRRWKTVYEAVQKLAEAAAQWRGKKFASTTGAF